MQKILILLLLPFLFQSTKAQDINIIPNPVDIKINKGNFLISRQTQIAYDKNSVLAARYLAGYLQKYYGISCRLTSDIHNNKAILLMTGTTDKPGYYELKSDKNGISIAGDETGVFYGVQTLIQLLPTSNPKPQTANFKLIIPCVSIEDAPRFAYRGMHLDVARHYMPVDFIKKYIDYLALHKFNTFHWHLTDDQGWRIEIKKYPLLTKVGSKRNGTIIGSYPGKGNDNIPDSGFYTQAQVKEIVSYAAARYITVIPEIEMPGHASAAIAAYPQLSCFPDEKTVIPPNMISNASKIATGKLVQETWGVFEDVFAPTEYTFNFLQDVLTEVMALFPSKYIHIGGDECPKEAWKRSAFCQQLIKEKGLKDEHGLQSYFIQRMEKYINSNGKKIIGWDEILEGGLAPNATVMSWRGEGGGIEAAKQKHDVIMTPGSPLYFDYSQSENEDSVTIGGYNPIEKVYAYEPVPKELNDEQGKYVLGAQANLWTEYIKHPGKVEYMVFPRMAALSEILWSAKEKRNWEDFEKRLLVQFQRYDLWKAGYSKALFDLKATISHTEHLDGVSWNILNGYPDGLFILRRFEEFSGIDTQVVYTSSHPTNFLKFETHESPWWRIKQQISGTNGQFNIQKEGRYTVTNYKIRSESGDEFLLDPNYPITSITQQFHFNKATGKKITLTNEPSKKYPGDGAFTLVNGVINEKGLAKAKEFIGFDGTDAEAIINLDSLQSISFVAIHALHSPSSWIWHPKSAEVFGSGDGQNWYPLLSNDNFMEKKDGTGTGTMIIGFRATYVQYVKVVVKNYGVIPPGNEGAGSKPWLFLDEIEIN